MTVLEIPDTHYTTVEEGEIRAYLNQRGIVFDRWSASIALDRDATESDVLQAYAHALGPYMESQGYQTADVIRIQPDTENLDAVRSKFLEEHTHSEDEVRFFVEGKGLFWFNLGGDEPVFAVTCEAGDLLGVPAGVRHWFDMGAKPTVTAIRIFSTREGWIPEYTQSGVSRRYSKNYEAVL